MKNIELGEEPNRLAAAIDNGDSMKITEINLRTRKYIDMSQCGHTRILGRRHHGIHGSPEGSVVGHFQNRIASAEIEQIPDLLEFEFLGKMYS